MRGECSYLNARNFAVARAPLSLPDSKRTDDCVPVETAMKEVLPDGLEGAMAVLPSDRKDQLTKYLRQLKRAEMAPRCQQQLSFILALLGTDYRQNRDNLFRALRTCGSARMSCDEDTVQYAITLYKRGHREALGTLLNAGTESDGAASALLGDFYRDTLLQNPQLFIRAVGMLTSMGRRQACFLAGTGDGSGTAPADLKHATEALTAIGGEVALACGAAFHEGAARVK